MILERAWQSVGKAMWLSRLVDIIIRIWSALQWHRAIDACGMSEHAGRWGAVCSCSNSKHGLDGSWVAMASAWPQCCIRPAASTRNRCATTPASHLHLLRTCGTYARADVRATAALLHTALDLPCFAANDICRRARYACPLKRAGAYRRLPFAIPFTTACAAASQVLAGKGF